MKLSDFDYHLPERLIAQKPTSPRDRSRLLIYDAKKDKVCHKEFRQIIELLKSGDVLVFNDSKVIPARLIGKKTTGGKIEVLLLKYLGKGQWQAMIGGKGKKEGLNINFAQGLACCLKKRLDDKTWSVEFNKNKKDIEKILIKIGKIPVPPYIKSMLNEGLLRKKYQTVYAHLAGSAAAPTAGLHFTKRLINQLNKKGVQLEFVTLHVGMGTFEPVRVENIKDHKIHSESILVKKEIIKRIKVAKEDGRRIIAVGTTSARTLEALSSEILNNEPVNIEKEVDIFIYPNYKFKIVDALITNFHLPKSTLLMLVAAFIGREKVLELYRLAVKKKYQFYSFGDAMFLF